MSVFSSSKCSLFHNSNVFGSCIIHILYTWCAKIKKKYFRLQKVKSSHLTVANALTVTKVKVKVKVKVKFTLEQAMKAQGGSRGIALLFL